MIARSKAGSLKRIVCLSAILTIAFSHIALAQDWPHVGGDAGGQRYSKAVQVSRENVNQLGVAWRYSTGEYEAFSKAGRTGWKFQATPILIQGKLIFCTPLNDVVALDPGTGREIWRYHANLPRELIPGNGHACRGVTAWRDQSAPESEECESTVFTGTLDFRIIALDLHTGRPCPHFGEGGTVKPEIGKTLLFVGEASFTSPPVVAQGVVVIGSAFGDNLRVDAPRGIVRAFDARTGVQLWQFDPLLPAGTKEPQGGELKSIDAVGHANAWSLLSVDQEKGIVYVPTSSPSVDHYGGNRPGDNQYANSTVALDIRTGEVIWSFQLVHHDLWDYDVGAQPSLIDIRQNGFLKEAVVQATKMGLIFTFERTTGEPIFKITERPVPQGQVPGEWYSPTQPFPEKPQILVPDHLSPGEAWGVSPWDRSVCEKKIATADYRGIYTPPSLGGSIHFPFASGGVNWGSTSYDPERQYLFVLTNNVAGYFKLIPRQTQPAREAMDVFKDGIAYQGGTPYLLQRELLTSPLGAPCNPPPWGKIHAIDMSTGEIAWERPIGTLEDFAPLGDLVLPHGVGNMGGVVSTKSGLLFVAATMDNYIRALSASSGEELWKARLPAGGQATPMTYVWQGEQYLVIAAGGHSAIGTTLGDQIIAFKVLDRSLWQAATAPERLWVGPTIIWLTCLSIVLVAGVLFSIRRWRAKIARRQ